MPRQLAIIRRIQLIPALKQRSSPQPRQTVRINHVRHRPGHITLGMLGWLEKLGAFTNTAVIRLGAGANVFIAGIAATHLYPTGYRHHIVQIRGNLPVAVVPLALRCSTAIQGGTHIGQRVDITVVSTKPLLVNGFSQKKDEPPSAYRLPQNSFLITVSGSLKRMFWPVTRPAERDRARVTESAVTFFI